MVDKIRHTAGIGGVNPLHPLRPLSRQDHSRQEGRDTPEQEPHAGEEKRAAAPVEPNDSDPASEEETPLTRPGRCIDIHI